MPKLNVDEIYEPIEIILDGKTYTVDKITQATLNKINKLGESSKDDEGKESNDPDVLGKQLGILLNTSASEFKNTDVRKMSKVIRYITDEITKDIEAENPTSKK